MASKNTSRFASAANWLRSSRWNVLAAGILAIGLISAVTIFAAEPTNENASCPDAVNDWALLQGWDDPSQYTCDVNLAKHTADPQAGAIAPQQFEDINDTDELTAYLNSDDPKASLIRSQARENMTDDEYNEWLAGNFVAIQFLKPAEVTNQAVIEDGQVTFSDEQRPVPSGDITFLYVDPNAGEEVDEDVQTGDDWSIGEYTQNVSSVGNIPVAHAQAGNPPVSAAEIQSLKNQVEKYRQAIETAKSQLATARKNGKASAIKVAEQKLATAQKNILEAKRKLAEANGKLAEFNQNQKEHAAGKKKKKGKVKDAGNIRKDCGNINANIKNPGKTGYLRVIKFNDKNGNGKQDADELWNNAENGQVQFKVTGRYAGKAINLGPYTAKVRPIGNGQTDILIEGLPVGEWTVTEIFNNQEWKSTTEGGKVQKANVKDRTSLCGVNSQKRCDIILFGNQRQPNVQVTPTPTTPPSGTPTPVPSGTPTTSPSGTPGPEGTPVPPECVGPQCAPGPNPPEGPQGEVKGVLPKTGNSGTVALITVLAAIAVYGIGRYALKHNKSKRK